MTNEELQEVLANKPFLTDIRLRIKYAVFIALIQRGWKGVRTSFSGVLTKNDFVLTLYKSDASTLEMQKPSKYLVPAAVNLLIFQILHGFLKDIIRFMLLVECRVFGIFV